MAVKFSDLNIDYGNNAYDSYIVDMTDIKYSLLRLFNTKVGSYPFNRLYGSSLYNLLFESSNSLDLTDIKVLLYKDITTWEPRVELNPLDISITKQDEHTFVITCSFTVPALNYASSSVTTSLSEN